jgi:sec-independent protein translocase protein TatA
MFRNLSLTEILFIVLLVVVLFGASRLGKVGRDLGTGIRSFKEGLQGKDETPGEEKKEDPKPEGSDEQGTPGKKE